MTLRRPSQLVVLAMIASVVVSALWGFLAWRTPTSTYHFAPLIAAAVGPYVAKAKDGPLSRHPSVVITLVSGAVALATIAVLALADRLRGPTFWSEGGAATEAVLFTVLGSLIGFFMLMRSSHSPVAEPDRSMSEQ